MVLAAIEFGHGEIKKIVAAIDELASKAGKTKRAFTAPEFDEGYYDELKRKVGDRLKDALDTKTHAKTESYALVKQIKDELAAELPADDSRTRRRSSRTTTKLCANASSASRSRRTASGPTAAPSTRFVPSPLRLACCPAPMVPRSLRAEKRRPCDRDAWHDRRQPATRKL